MGCGLVNLVLYSGRAFLVIKCSASVKAFAQASRNEGWDGGYGFSWSSFLHASGSCQGMHDLLNISGNLPRLTNRRRKPCLVSTAPGVFRATQSKCKAGPEDLVLVGVTIPTSLAGRYSSDIRHNLDSPFIPSAQLMELGPDAIGDTCQKDGRTGSSI